MPTDLDWPSWTRALAETIRGLDDGAAVVVTAPASASRPVRLRKARLGGFIPARHRFVAPWVRLARSEEHLKGSCVGAEGARGRFPFSPEERAALADLGWHDPPPLEGDDSTHWWPDDVPTGPFLPEDDAGRAAVMVADTFRTVLSPPTEDDPAPELPTVTSD